MKKVILSFAIIFAIITIYAQASLPTSYGWEETSYPTGWTASGLGTYSSSTAVTDGTTGTIHNGYKSGKFDTTNDNLVINFTVIPSTLVYWIKGTSSSGAFEGTFKIQSSIDGITYTDVRSLLNEQLSLTYTQYSESLPSDSRYVKFLFSNKISGFNVALDDISISSSSTPSSYPPVITAFNPITTPPAQDANQNITATVTDADNNLAVVKLYYKINNGSTVINNMTSLGSGNYEYAIPASAYANGDLVEYWIYAADSGTGADFHEVESSHYKFAAGTTFISTLRNNDANEVSVYNGALCRVTGVAYNNDGVFSAATTNDCFLLDSTGGLDAYKNPALSSFSFSENHSYTVVGDVTNFNGKLEVVMRDAIDNGVAVFPAYQVVTAAQLSADPENYEGKYIAIQGLSRTGTTAWPTTNSNTNLTLTDGTSNVNLYLYGTTDCYLNAEPTWPKDIKGIFSQYDSSSPYTSGYQLIIKGFSEIQNNGTLPVTFSSFNATLTGSQTVSLAWTTESESSLRGFNIYRSENNNTVDAIAVSPMIAANNTSSVSNYSFTDDEVSVNNTYYYWVVSTEQNGHNEWYGPCNITVNGSVTPQVPTSTELYKAYPNPINTNRANLNIECKVGTEETAMLTIYNVKGQSVKTYNLNSGVHNVQWDGKDLNGNRCSSGVYFYRLSSPTTSSVGKVLILK